MIEAADSEQAPMAEPEPEAALPAVGQGAGRTAGAMLREAREAAGLHVGALAVSLKVPPAKLEALEHDQYDKLPDAVFTRALASSVCRTLKIEAGPILERLPQSAAPRLVQDTDGINAPFRSPRDNVAITWRDQLTRPVSLLVGALLIGVVAVVLWPYGQSVDVGAASAAGDASPAVTVAAKPFALKEAPAVAATAPESTPPAEIIQASVAMPAPAEAPAGVQPPAPATPPAATGTAAAAADSAAPPSAGAGVVFRASGQSWVEVRDAKGAVPLRKMLAAGESANVSGAMPLQVIVGNVDATQVEVRGKPFDLKSMARDNVARFQVK